MKSNKQIRIKKKIIEAIGKGSTINCACAFAGVAATTMYEWVKKDAKFGVKIDRAKYKQVDLVVGALFKRAVGYEYDEVHVEEVKVLSEKKGVKYFVPATKTKTITKHYCADVGAQVFYLCNRDSDWKNTQNIIHASDPKNPIPISVNGVMLSHYPKQKTEKGKDE